MFIELHRANAIGKDVEKIIIKRSNVEHVCQSENPDYCLVELSDEDGPILVKQDYRSMKKLLNIR